MNSSLSNNIQQNILFYNKPLSYLSTALAFASSLWATQVHRRDASIWPNGPFSTDGRWVVDASGQQAHFAGVNWPGAAEVMIPEGLLYRLVEQIVSQIKSVGFNAVRLTYAIEIVDQIYDYDGKDISIEIAFVNGPGSENGTLALAKVLENNPSFTNKKTRLQVFDSIAEELAKKQIHVLLDNHISKAKWCCSGSDGNTWWGDSQFNVANWLPGLSYMATHTWYKYVQQGAKAINNANGDVLVYLSGLGYDTWMTPMEVSISTALTPGKEIFGKGAFAGFSNKLVLEIHNYEKTVASCATLKSRFYTKGLQGMNSTDAATKAVFPVQLIEWGHLMDATTWQGVYSICLRSYVGSLKASWFMWAIAGSYYTRYGKPDNDELWGLLNHNWTEWRNPDFVKSALTPFIHQTLDS
ncbi:Beta-16-galactanase [Fusarium acutatum]|uniref:Beta-16-galactanase n=1 Tax=Fusarium acutatum TaxID=78861 RepID=A0A8H4NCL4_9HYPO|nr:Beta-16-galactanase [Fusarium acutatum]